MSENKNLKKCEGFLEWFVVGECVVLDFDFELMYQLNLMVIFVWEFCDGKFDLDGIVEELVQCFDVEFEMVCYDVEYVIVIFVELGFFED